MLGLQHVVTLDIRLQHIAVAPPRGVRGLKYQRSVGRRLLMRRRTPSWGAWIEIYNLTDMVDITSRRTPSWGAWIEMSSIIRHRIRLSSHPLVGCVD